MTRVVLTGAGGFVGRNLLKQFATGDFQVLVFSSQWEKLEKQFAYISRFSFMDAKAAQKSSAFRKEDILIHCAFPCNNDGVQLAQAIAYSKNVLCSAVAADVGAVVNISSQSVYNPSRIQPADENTEVHLSDIYSAGKYSVEMMMEALCAQIPHTSLRMASLIGPDTVQKRVINRMVGQVLAGVPMTIFEYGQKFGYLDGRDAVSAILCLVAHDPEEWEPIYNVGTDNIYTVTQIADTVIAVGASLGYDIPQPQYMEKLGNTLNSAVCAKRFMHAFDWKPVYTLEETVREMFEVLRG